MNQVTFTQAANGQATCKANGTLLHSSYNPSREAERFANTVSCQFIPKFILVTGACLSYCAEFLRKKYPASILCAVQFTEDFAKQNALWDRVFLFTQKNSTPLSDELFDFMGDEGIISCFFVSWQPSEKAFPENYAASWVQIKKAVLKSRSVLATRSFFAKKWAKNALRFCLFVKHTAYIQSGKVPVVVCASGKSLEGTIPSLKKMREFYFLVAVSSALSPLLQNGITPDLVISTDGGYWAKKHLLKLIGKENIPLALPLEASAYASTLSEQTIIPLSYGDGIAEALISSCGYEAMEAARNGTVSGTAALLALKITTGSVFFCGLDLAGNKGFPHTQPNELELTDSVNDRRLFTKESRITPRTFNSVPLEVYRAWFSNADFNGRLYRLSDNFSYANKLGHISDVDLDFFEEKCKMENKNSPAPIQIFSRTKNFSQKERALRIEKTIQENLWNAEWIKNAVPTDAIIWERSVGTENEEAYRKTVEKKMLEFANDLICSLKKTRGNKNE